MPDNPRTMLKFPRPNRNDTVLKSVFRGQVGGEKCKSAFATAQWTRCAVRTGCFNPAARSLHRLSFSEIAGMIEMAGLQVGARDRDFRERCLRQNLGGDIVDRRIGDLMNEANVFVFAGRNARDDFAPGDFGIDDGLAPAPT